MKCIIRDDDTCALTRVEELENCYGSVDVPVCLSVTPFRIPGEYPGYTGDAAGKPQALERNRELVAYLKEGYTNKKYDFAMHGYHHVHWQGEAGEPAGLDPDFSDTGRPWWREYLYGNDLLNKTAEGKQYLERVLDCRITTFVPPGNAISRQGLEAVICHGLNLIGVPKLRLFGNPQRPSSINNYLNAARRMFWRLRHVRCNKYPFVLDFGDHKEVDYYLLYPSTDLGKLMEDIDFVHSVDGIFILSTHYYAFDRKIASGETIRDALGKVLEYLHAKDGVDFIDYHELWGAPP
jgi:hypothetical protein